VICPHQIRIIFRLVQYSPGTGASNPVVTHEAYEYGLDALPMLLALIILNFAHPGRVLHGPESEFPRLSREEKKMLKQEKKQMKAARKAAKSDMEQNTSESDGPLQPFGVPGER
jgi:RTA1 like protein